MIQIAENKAGEKAMAKADSNLVYWLLHDSGLSKYKISKDVGISEPTLSRIVNGKTPLKEVKFGFAHKLTEYALKVKELEEPNTIHNRDSRQEGEGQV